MQGTPEENKNPLSLQKKVRPMVQKVKKHPLRYTGMAALLPVFIFVAGEVSHSLFPSHHENFCGDHR